MRSLSTLFLLPVIALAQSKPAPTPADYGQFESLAPFGVRNGGLSPDGKWLVYLINRSNGNNELRITSVASGEGGAAKVVGFGTQPAYSADSKWLAYSIGYSEAQQDKMRKDKKPIHNKLGLMNLTSGEQSTVDGIEVFAFSPDGTWLAMRRYPPEKAGGSAGPAAEAGGDDAPAGATLILRQLANGRDTTFGNVGGMAWQDTDLRGHFFALSITTEDKTGNSFQLFDTATQSLRTLDSSSSIYSMPVWRKNSVDLLVLRSKSDDKREGTSNSVLAWTGLGGASETARVYDPAKDAKFPAAARVVTYRRPSWNEAGDTVFLGVAPWYEKPATSKDKKSDDADEPASVDVWHWRDTEVMARQKKSALQEGRRNLLAAWYPATGQFVQLGRERTESLIPLKHQKLAYAAEWKAYAMERSIGRPAADLYLVDLANGERTKIKDRLPEDHYVQASPNGRYLLYLQDDQYFTINTATKATVNLTKNIKTSFVDKESDVTIKQKPAYGVAGWTKDDADVLLYDKFDVWKVAADGSRATKLTDGAAEQVRHRVVRLDPDEESIDLSKPVYLSLFGTYSKKSGYARLNGSSVERLAFPDKSIARLAKAKDAEVYDYVQGTFEESPNIYVGGAMLKDAKRLTDTNPFQSKYAWGHSELIEYKNPAGERLQGALYYPAGYEQGRKYPMVVYMYEKLSDGLHNFSAPSERNYYSPSAFTSHGYFLLMPDIVFRPREPGLSVAECVTAAVKRVVQMGVVDEKKVGVIGHSWGGFDASFLATHSNAFAAAVAGAPITDLVSNYGNHHWSSGIAETDHIETGQQRMEVPLWEDLQAYIRNSAVFNAQNMTTPLLIEVGDADGTVFYHQGVELYNIARRAKKDVVLLVYGSEDHGLRKKADQVDYQHRIFAWFGHYLKGEPAPAWITEGESYLDHQRELKKAKP